MKQKSRAGRREVSVQSSVVGIRKLASALYARRMVCAGWVTVRKGAWRAEAIVMYLRPRELRYMGGVWVGLLMVPYSPVWSVPASGLKGRRK